jgi:hypothetical protein
MEDVGIFYGHLVHFTVFYYILLTFSIVCGNLVYFPRLGILYQEKSGNPGTQCSRKAVTTFHKNLGLVLFFVTTKTLCWKTLMLIGLRKNIHKLSV